MVMDPAGGQVNLPGTHTTEPTFGLPATWIDGALKEDATLKGYTVVDAATVLSTHLTELLKTNMSELLSYGEVQKLLKEVPKEQADLVKDLVPNADHHLRHPARPADAAVRARLDPRPFDHPRRHRRCHPVLAQPAAHRRARPRPALAPDLRPVHQPSGYLPLIALSAQWEQAFAESIIGQGDERQLAMQPSRLSEFIMLVRERFEAAAREGEAPVLVTSAAIRPFVRGIVERFRAQTPVMSQAEIHPRAGSRP